jgi:hypothetical protein
MPAAGSHAGRYPGAGGEGWVGVGGKKCKVGVKLDNFSNILSAIALLIAIFSLVLSFRGEKERRQIVLIEKKNQGLISMLATASALERIEKNLYEAKAFLPTRLKSRQQSLIHMVQEVIGDLKECIDGLGKFEIGAVSSKRSKLLHEIVGRCAVVTARSENLISTSALFLSEVRKLSVADNESKDLQQNES